MLDKLSAFLRKAGGRLRLPFRGSQAPLQEALATSWLSMRLAVLRGEVQPDARIVVSDPTRNGKSGFMTVQAVLKTVEAGWGYWDRKTQEWWYRVLEDANSYFGLVDTAPGAEVQGP
ncbi:MAG: hypothetical protein Q8O76_07715, partial [Chloroflexota bacterium]|nr:hypothetical protein [Chloroflexota bacterium]